MVRTGLAQAICFLHKKAKMTVNFRFSLEIPHLLAKGQRLERDETDRNEGHVNNLLTITFP